MGWAAHLNDVEFDLKQREPEAILPDPSLLVGTKIIPEDLATLGELMNSGELSPFSDRQYPLAKASQQCNRHAVI
jgi:hypothetical protein